MNKLYEVVIQTEKGKELLFVIASSVLEALEKVEKYEVCELRENKCRLIQ